VGIFFHIIIIITDDSYKRRKIGSDSHNLWIEDRLKLKINFYVLASEILI
jgi:hypothetical protein